MKCTGNESCSAVTSNTNRRHSSYRYCIHHVRTVWRNDGRTNEICLRCFLLASQRRFAAVQSAPQVRRHISGIHQSKWTLVGRLLTFKQYMIAPENLLSAYIA